MFQKLFASIKAMVVTSNGFQTHAIQMGLNPQHKQMGDEEGSYSDNYLLLRESQPIVSGKDYALQQEIRDLALCTLRSRKDSMLNPVQLML